MKYLLIAILPIIAQAKEVEPKFYMYEQITYKIGFFYHKVCNGKGQIHDVRTESNGAFTYTINTYGGDNCPATLDRDEKDIKAAE